MRLICSALGLLLVMKAFLLLISLPHVYAYKDGGMNRNGIAEKQSFMSAHDQEEAVNAFSSTATKIKMEQLGGRKMAVQRKVEIKNKRGFHGGATPQVISGRFDNNCNNIGFGGSDQHQFIHQEQKKTKKLEPNMQKKSGILGSPRHEQVRHNTNRKTKECEESKAKPTRASLEDPDNILTHQFQRLLLHDHNTHSHPKPKAEKQRLLLEATKEIVNLIHKDYKGVDRPRRKPPINNNVPIH